MMFMTCLLPLFLAQLPLTLPFSLSKHKKIIHPFIEYNYNRYLVLFFIQLNVLLKSALVCIDFYFLLRMGRVILILLLLNNFGFYPRCFLYSVLNVWILFYSSEECCFLFLCFQVLHWLDSNCKVCLSDNCSNFKGYIDYKLGMCN